MYDQVLPEVFLLELKGFKFTYIKKFLQDNNVSDQRKRTNSHNSTHMTFKLKKVDKLFSQSFYINYRYFVGRDTRVLRTSF